MSRPSEPDVSVLQPRLGTRLGILLTSQLVLDAVLLRVHELANTVYPHVLRLSIELYPAFETSCVMTLVAIARRQAVDRKTFAIRRKRHEAIY